MKKAQLDVVSVKDNKDGSCDIKIDTNDEGRRILMQAGMIKALENMLEDNIGKLSWWERFKYAWRCSIKQNKRNKK
jgi:hypothetical protein